MQKTLFLIFINLISILSFSQSEDFDKKFGLANKYYQRKDFKHAEHYLLECYKIDSTNIDVLIKINQISVKKKDWEHVAFLSHKLKNELTKQSLKYSKFEIQAYFYLQEYSKAEQLLKSCYKNHKMNIFDAEVCRKLEQNIAFAKEAIQHPVPYQPINLGRNINSKYAEYLPNLTQDGKYLIYTRMTALSKAFPSLQEDFYISQKKDGKWQKSIPLSRTLNSKRNEGAPSISADGTVLFFAACNRPDGKGSCDIYYSFNRGNFWTSPKNARSINTKSWDSQPNISSDGKTLYFSSERAGGIGKRDIWAVDILGEGEFGKPYNLGSFINTKYNEMSPFIHFDNQTLYFASDGWPGMGAKDIFLCRRLEDNSWSKPENLGYPINSSESDNSLFVSPDGSIAYFASNRENGFGKEDIYQFDLYKKAQPKKTAFYKVLVLASDTKKPLKISYNIINNADRTTSQTTISDNGEITFGIKANQEYSISAYANGYLYYSDLIQSVSEDSLVSINTNIFLNPIQQNDQFVLKNIEFDFDKATLRNCSTQELDLFANYLLSNPKIKILIEGHTDNKGQADYNLKLSQERANTVKTYLIGKQINTNRLSSKGFGSTQLLSKKENLQDRNRRVVIKIIDH